MATNRDIILCSTCHQTYNCVQQEETCPHGFLPEGTSGEEPPGMAESWDAPGGYSVDSGHASWEVPSNTAGGSGGPSADGEASGDDGPDA